MFVDTVSLPDHCQAYPLELIITDAHAATFAAGFGGIFMRWISAILVSAVLAPMMGAALSAHAQVTATITPLITQAINEANLMTLAGNTRPEAKTATDLGAVPNSYPLPHMLLQLKRSAASEQALENEIVAQQNPASPQFHHWLAPSDFGARYGLAASDLKTITGWLVGRGFTVNVVYGNGVLIDFSGTAGQVRQAFHTQIHALNVGGSRHIANISNPQFPPRWRRRSRASCRCTISGRIR